ncbi:MAG: histidine--tRNA ligase [Bacteroidetes bacterium]|nr:histidine--tRNA ligase [Bacteroidota bacterium]
MTKVKAGIPQGTRDFSAEVVKKRDYIVNTIKTVFELYGFQPLETPAMENLETLMGKYGEEGDRLIFKILNNGLDNPAKHQQVKEDFEKVLEGKSVKSITERALRYDLTIPFARYVSMNHGQLTFPFKRYQVQPVWRADRPQKGRYREFFQCDVDIVGSYSLLNEVELSNIYATVFKKLGLAVEIKINSRKLLQALAEICGGAEKMMDITIAIDKLDKIGIEKVKEELEQKNLTKDQIAIIEKYLSISGTSNEKLEDIKSLFGNNDNGKKGIEEIEFVLNYQDGNQNELPLSIDLTLARGLNYYTGIILEVKSTEVQMGSIGGGGRYDDLTGLFGVPNIPGVGISFGLDRIYDVIEELNKFPEEVGTGTQVLFFNLGDVECKKAFGLMQQLRDNNIRCEIYHEQAKFDKQFKYAEKKKIGFVVIIGSEELKSGNCSIKNLLTGEQQTISSSSILKYNFHQ